MKVKKILRFMIAVFFSIGIASIGLAQDAPPPSVVEKTDKPPVLTTHKGHLKPVHPHKKHKGRKSEGKTKKKHHTSATKSASPVVSN